MPDAVMVLVPSGPEWSARFGMCLSTMLYYEGLRRTIPIAFKNRRSSILPNLRQELLDAALSHENATHALFIDSDMVFPKTTCKRLLAAHADVIGCCCSTKGIPSYATAWIAPDQVLDIRKATRRVQRVWRVGCGIMLIKLDAIRELPRPHFGMRWRAEAGSFQGEDWGFCERLEEAGVPIHVETELSLEIGHMGQFCYGVEDLAPDLDAKSEDK